ncbi:MAG: DUF799 domain-containing protein [Opitutales bacterium]|nr:DUF799 domain-containing protein [Opitutales bacterium]
MRNYLNILLFTFVALIITGCKTIEPKDYSLFEQHRPKSILIVPPKNSSTEINAGFAVLTQSVEPISELGYYVYPVVLVNDYFIQNGLTVADEIHNIPIKKLDDVFGTDAVLYINVENYGSKYQVFASNTYVYLSAKLVDCKSGLVFWENRTEYVYAGSSGLIEALIEQIVNKLADTPFKVAELAAHQCYSVPGQGLLLGHRHPEFGGIEPE